MEQDTLKITTQERPHGVTLSPTERIQFLANLIIDRMIEDQNNGSTLLKKLMGRSNAADTSV